MWARSGEERTKKAQIVGGKWKTQDAEREMK